MIKPAALLGEVSHELSYLCWNGRFDEFDPSDLKSHVSVAWEKQLAELITKRGLDDQSKVDPLRWPNYQRVRTRTIRQLVNTISRRKKFTSGQRKSGTQILKEESLRSNSSPLFGRPDRIVIRSEVVEIIDLKTARAAEDGIPEKAKDQLLLYAALWREVRGKLPQKLTVEALDGTRSSIDVDESEVGRVRDEALSNFRDFNELVDTGSLGFEHAVPNSDTCKYCDYKAMCRPFFESYLSEWDWYQVDLFGVATQTYGTGNLRTVGLTCVYPAYRNGDQVVVVDVPEDLVPDVETRVGFSGLYKMRGSGNYGFALGSDISVWE